MPLLNTAAAIRKGSSTVAAVYAGATKVWPPFAPSSVPNLAAWYDASQLAQANGAAIPQLNDRSGNVRNAAQATGSLQPICIKPGLNGLAVARFDGVDDYLLTGAWPWQAQHTVLCVAKANDTVPAGDGICNASNASGPLRVFQLRQQDAATAQGAAFNDAGSGFTNSEPSATQAWHRYTYVRTLVDCNLYLDGATSGATPTTGTAPSFVVAMYLGSANLQAKVGAIDLAEVLIYDRVLTSTERGQLEQWLRTKWALP